MLATDDIAIDVGPHPENIGRPLVRHTEQVLFTADSIIQLLVKWPPLNVDTRVQGYFRSTCAIGLPMIQPAIITPSAENLGL